MAAMKGKNPKYIFVVGGVMSGVGKGITASSIGKILQSRGLKVSLMKADPYLNVDAGTMNPTEHGEVFVLGSGLETDQDMGNYERFLNVSLPEENYMTNGMVFKYVIDKERALGYKGKCVEPTYHITEEILRRIKASVEKTDADVAVIEIGGTVGEYQNAIFIEAARKLKLKNRDDVMFVMVSYLPTPSTLGEMKTKPTQNAIMQMNSYGVHPDIVIARASVAIDKKRKEKIANMSGLVSANHVIAAPDIESIYDVPVNFEKEGLSRMILDHFGFKSTKNDMRKWKAMAETLKGVTDEVSIAIVGKYFNTGNFVLSDAYISIIEALRISGIDKKVKVKLDWLNAGTFKGRSQLKTLNKYDGILVPGGFGETGIEGKIKVIQYARENKIPYFGICYGMQMMVVEYARNVLGMKNAQTTEINPDTETPIVCVMPDQIVKLKNDNYGGTMRLGEYQAEIQKGTIAYKAYKKTNVNERHRHRYEINPDYVAEIEAGGMIFSGKSPNGVLMEIAELPEDKHPFFLGTQFHPEFLARPLDPHPLFSAFIEAIIKNKK